MTKFVATTTAPNRQMKLPNAGGNEAAKRWGIGRFVRMVKSQVTKRFMQLLSMRLQLICRVVIRLSEKVITG
jgi:hypothetical protein